MRCKLLPPRYHATLEEQIVHWLSQAKQSNDYNRFYFANVLPSLGGKSQTKKPEKLQFRLICNSVEQYGEKK